MPLSSVAISASRGVPIYLDSRVSYTQLRLRPFAKVIEPLLRPFPIAIQSSSVRAKKPDMRLVTEETDQVRPIHLYAPVPASGIYIGPGTTIAVHADKSKLEQDSVVTFAIHDSTSDATIEVTSTAVNTTFSLHSESPTDSGGWLQIERFDSEGSPVHESGQAIKTPISLAAAAESGLWITHATSGGSDVLVHILGVAVTSQAFDLYQQISKVNVPYSGRYPVRFWIEWEDDEVPDDTTFKSEQDTGSRLATDDSSQAPTSSVKGTI